MSQKEIEEELKKKMKTYEASEKEDDDDSSEEDDKDEEDEEDEEDKMPPKKAKSKAKSKKEDKEDMKEETLAAKSLHPKGAPGEPMSKIGMMSQVTGAMAQMSKSDMIGFFNQVMGQFGPGKDYGVGDKSGQNQSTLDMKPSDAVATKGPKTKYPMPSVKEDIEEMFVGEELSEEFREKASTLFEAALNARVTAEVVRIEEEYEAVLREEMETFAEEVTDKLDTYLNYVVENWMTENEVAIESTLRNEISAQFIDDLKDLFSENYMDVPEEKVDVIEQLADKIDALEARLDESISENQELKSVLSESVRKDLIDEVSSDLTLTQQEKFQSFAEGIEFDGDVDGYQRKLEIIKENYFVNTTPPQTNLEEETYEGEETQARTVSVDPSIARYVSALQKTVKR